MIKTLKKVCGFKRKETKENYFELSHISIQMIMNSKAISFPFFQKKKSIIKSIKEASFS